MICILKHIKTIAYIFTILILIQSCVAYRPKPVSEAFESYDRKMRVTTANGKKHKLRWLEKKENNAVSIRNTNKIRMEISDIEQIKTLSDSYPYISLDSALKHPGIIEVFNKKSVNQGYGEFINLERYGDNIIGLEIIGKDTAKVMIPIKDIYMIELENKNMSGVQTIALTLGTILVSLITWAVIDVAINGIQIYP
jgi:hypothetical protein